MSSSKKLVTLIIILSITLIIAITATIIVLVASNQTALSNVAVEYTATDVVGELSATYTIDGTNKTPLKDGSGNTVIKFSSKNTSGYLSPTEKLKLTIENRNVIFEYKFSNTSSNIPMSVMLTHLPDSNTQGEKAENVTVKYFVTTEEINASYYDSIEMQETSLIDFKQTVPTNSQKFVYIEVKLINITQNADFTGSINWVLERASTDTSNAISMQDSSSSETITNISTTVYGGTSTSIKAYIASGMNSSYLTASYVSEGGENLTITKGSFTSTAIRATNAGYVTFTISRPTTITKTFYAIVTFTYDDGINYPVSACVKVGFSTVSTFEFKLDNDDDKNYGLEQKHVFGTWKLKPDSTKDWHKKDYTYQMQYTLVDSGSERLYWSSSNNSIATVSDAGLVTFTSEEFVGEKTVTIYASNRENYEESEVKDSYTFTLVNGCNIYSTKDFELTRVSMMSVVLQTSLGVSSADQVADRPYVTDFTYVEDDVYDIINVQIYGNGFVMNFKNFDVSGNDGFGFCRHANTTTLNKIYNLVVRGTNNQNIVLTEREVYYTIFEGANEIFTATTTQTATFENCIFRNMATYGILIGEENANTINLKNNIFSNTGMAGIFFDDNGNAGSKLYINGFFDVYNFKQKSDYDSTFQTAIQGFIDDNPTYVSNGKVNAVILRAEVSFSSLKSMTEDLYFNERLITSTSPISLAGGWTYNLISRTFSIIGSAELVTINPTTNGITDTSTPDYTKVQRLGTNTVSTYL